MRFEIKIREHIKLAIGVAVITSITCLPLSRKGIPGYFPDMMYHFLRIESVKDSILHGEYLAKIHVLFYGGYGYGGSMFYPNLFLVIPAIMRIVGIEPILTWKLFSGIVCLVASLSTYFSMKYVIKDKNTSSYGNFYRHVVPILFGRFG